MAKTRKRLKEYKRVFNHVKTNIDLSDPRSRGKKGRTLGTLKLGDELDDHGYGVDRRDITSTPLFKSDMLTEIGDVMDIVKTIQVRDLR